MKEASSAGWDMQGVVFVCSVCRALVEVAAKFIFRGFVQTHLLSAHPK